MLCHVGNRWSTIDLPPARSLRVPVQRGVGRSIGRETVPSCGLGGRRAEGDGPGDRAGEGERCRGGRSIGRERVSCARGVSSMPLLTPLAAVASNRMPRGDKLSTMRRRWPPRCLEVRGDGCSLTCWVRCGGRGDKLLPSVRLLRPPREMKACISSSERDPE